MYRQVNKYQGILILRELSFESTSSKFPLHMHIHVLCQSCLAAVRLDTAERFPLSPEPTAVVTCGDLWALGLVVLPLPPHLHFFYASRYTSSFIFTKVLMTFQARNNFSCELWWQCFCTSLRTFKETSTLLFIHTSDILWWTVSAWRAGFMSDPFLYLLRDLAQ